MSIALSIAASGIAAAALRLQVSASIIANALSFGPLPNAKNSQGFPPAYIPLLVDQTVVAGGGTMGTVRTTLPSYVPIYDPTAFYADNRGMVAAPNVDLVSSLIEQILAHFTYAANAKVASADSRMMGVSSRYRGIICYRTNHQTVSSKSVGVSSFSKISMLVFLTGRKFLTLKAGS